MTTFLPLLSLACSLLALVAAGFVWFRYDPLAVLDRLEQLEGCAPWAICEQQMAAFSLRTDDILETAGVKLQKAHDRKGPGSRTKQAGDPPVEPPVPLDPRVRLEMERASVRQQLRLRGVEGV